MVLKCKFNWHEKNFCFAIILNFDCSFLTSLSSVFFTNKTHICLYRSIILHWYVITIIIIIPQYACQIATTLTEKHLWNRRIVLKDAIKLLLFLIITFQSPSIIMPEISRNTWLCITDTDSMGVLFLEFWQFDDDSFFRVIKFFYIAQF